MATSVRLKHPQTGLSRQGFYGFSWTSFFFGFFPALFRGDYMTFIGGFVIQIILGAFTFGLGAIIASIVWAFIYNKYYTTKLLERGYVFDDSEQTVTGAKLAFGIA
ncbi:MAG: hypothetical protein GX458_01595 [Phyllobacteriaceae bacterium]|nr:hypothetical protein [Phyllobacteriaceae bacterium]